MSRASLTSAAEGADGMAAADDLAQGGEIGTKIVQRLGAAEGKAQRDHLVENEDDAVALGFGAQVLEVAVHAGEANRQRP